MPGLRASTGCVRRVVNANLARKKPLASEHELLFWDAQNRLSEVQDNNGGMLEQYWYDAGGGRVKKTSGTTTAISHYSFGGLRIAVKRGSALYHLHGDHLGSASLTTAGSVVEASRAYYAYGAERAASGTLQTDRTFTGQKADASGLLYYNARYYDPGLGTFISPDSLVPDPGRVIDYNRFLYARGNPLKYSDPTGRFPFGPDWEREFETSHGRPPNAGDRVDRLISLMHPGHGPGGAWTDQDWSDYSNNKREVLTRVIATTGIRIGSGWNLSDPIESDNLTLLAEGIVEFGFTVGTAIGGGVQAGLARLGQLLGGPVTWVRGPSGWGTCKGTPACALGRAVSFHNALFSNSSNERNRNHVRATAVHEMAHVIHTVSCATVMGMGRGCEVQLGLVVGVGFGLEGRGPHTITQHGETNQWEYWAEAVTDWVYKDLYMPSVHPQGDTYKINDSQLDYIEGVFNGQ